MHSTSSQSSSMSRPRTKAALKGYDNMEMTLPSTRIEIQHTVNRSPTSSACKLAALADIALSNPIGLLEPPQPTVYDTKGSPKASRMSVSPAKTSIKQSPSLLMSSDSIKAHSMELKTKSYDASFAGTPKSRKRARQSAGKRTGYKEKKKKARSEKSTERTVIDSSKPKDVYDFEESHDSVEDEIIPLTHTRPTKTESQSNVDAKSTDLASGSVQNDEPDDESSYSDRDDFYNYNSVSCSGTEDTQETPITNDDANSDQDTKSSSLSQDRKSPTKAHKKHLIMGRIFKNVNKKENASTDVKEHKKPIPKVVQKPIPENELDEIFNNLKNKDSDVVKRAPVERQVKTPKSERKTKNVVDSPVVDSARDKKKKPNESPRKAHKEQSTPTSEQSGRAKESPKRKTQRRCATNRQNKFVETWSSDEYEEFHSTKDIIALIQEAEMKEQRSKEKTAKQASESVAKDLVDAKPAAKESNVSKTTKKEKRKRSSDRVDVSEKKSKPSDGKDVEKSAEKKPKPKVKKAQSTKFESEDESDFDEHWNKSAKRAKMRKRRQTISSRPDDIPEEKSNKAKTTEKPNKPRNSTKKVVQEETKPTAGPSSEKKKTPKGSGKHRDGAKASGKTKAGDRKKRMASDTLYYWSSSSDEEFGRIEASDNEDDSGENQLEQHGWIVGDSHKKLVTLLAHAKGKKHDDGGVKETVHKRK